MPGGHEQFEQSTQNLAFSSDAEYEAWLDGPDAMQWVAQEATAVLCYVTYISESALTRMHSLTMRYRRDYSGVTGTRYFMNHCEHCDAKLGDFETIEECDAPLRPIGGACASRLLHYPVNERLEADSSSKCTTEADLSAGAESPPPKMVVRPDGLLAATPLVLRCAPDRRRALRDSVQLVRRRPSCRTADTLVRSSMGRQKSIFDNCNRLISLTLLAGCPLPISPPEHD